KWNPRELTPSEYDTLSESERAYVDFHDGKILLMNDPERYMNHSCKPNTVSHNQADLAHRDIQAGEELTTDYADCNPPDFSMGCTCGSPNCRGTIRGRA